MIDNRVPAANRARKTQTVYYPAADHWLVAKPTGDADERIMCQVRTLVRLRPLVTYYPLTECMWPDYHLTECMWPDYHLTECMHSEAECADPADGVVSACRPVQAVPQQAGAVHPLQLHKHRTSCHDNQQDGAQRRQRPWRRRQETPGEGQSAGAGGADGVVEHAAPPAGRERGREAAAEGAERAEQPQQ